jgi:putative transcriptional regulator
MTAETLDTLESLYARYVAGTLSTPARVLVASHLELKPQALPFISDLEALAGDALDTEMPIRVENADHRLTSIFASDAPRYGETASAGKAAPHDAIMPRALAAFVGHGVDDIPWRTKMPGFREYDLGDIEGCHVQMFWIKPGRAIPSHTHEGTELFLVIDGSFSDGDGHYGRGDISVADSDIDHRPVAGLERPCIGFSVTDAPLRLTGSIGRRISDILGG